VHRRGGESSRVWSRVGCGAMTVRVTTLKGADAGAYYVEALPNYYLDSGEPRGVWLGAAAGMLRLAGEVDGGHFLSLMAGMDPHRPDRSLGRPYDESSVRGFDVTCSAPKSVSVMFAIGGDDVRGHVLTTPRSPRWLGGSSGARTPVTGSVER
jgi:TrwC relaxase